MAETNSISNNEIWRKFTITGLVYPAVLGSIIYSFLRKVLEPEGISNASEFALDSILILEVIVLYFLDYSFTNVELNDKALKFEIDEYDRRERKPYSPVIFAVDLLIILTLFLTTQALSIENLQVPKIILPLMLSAHKLLVIFWDTCFLNGRKEFRRADSILLAAYLSIGIGFLAGLLINTHLVALTGLIILVEIFLLYRRFQEYP